MPVVCMPLKVDVPERAAKIFESSDTFRVWISSLDLICTIYNKIKKNILSVEEPLVKDKLLAVEVLLDRGMQELNWRVSARHLLEPPWAPAWPSAGRAPGGDWPPASTASLETPPAFGSSPCLAWIPVSRARAALPGLAASCCCGWGMKGTAAYAVWSWHHKACSVCRVAV